VWYTSKGIKIDFYRKDVSGIPISKIFSTATSVKVKKSDAIRVMCLELSFNLESKFAKRISRPSPFTR